MGNYQSVAERLVERFVVTTSSTPPNVQRLKDYDIQLQKFVPDSSEFAMQWNSASRQHLVSPTMFHEKLTHKIEDAKVYL
jgi:hypothetical protein